MRGIRSLSLAALIAAVCFLAPLGAEVRALWAMPWSIATRGGIDSLITAAVASRQTDILVEVRYRSDALYQTNRLPDDFPNPEPRSYILKSAGFDPLEYALREGHKNNLRVHAWFVAFNATPVDSVLIERNYIYQNHPDWITHDAEGRRQEPGTRPGCFVDPGLPEVREHLLTVVGDILTGYPLLDGLHLDYVRYPGPRWGYHPLAVAAFNTSAAQIGVSWNKWRAEQVTSFVVQARRLADSISPGLVLSAAVLPDPEEARERYAQDWLSWLERGIIDHAYPMAYGADAGDFARVLHSLSQYPLKSRMILGIRAWNDNGDPLENRPRGTGYGVMDVADRIRAAREKGFAGISLFSYDGMKEGDAFAQLANFCFSEMLIARMNFRENPLGKGVKYAADLDAAPAGRRYGLELRLPAKGRWNWEIRDLKDNVLYRRKAFYLKGTNADDWNGVLPDGSQIPAGCYLACLFRDHDCFKYVMPITLPELDL
ncbi:MAG: glycoside hydrolase family 10 protein [Candidatus Syntrophosphaera sp.]